MSSRPLDVGDEAGFINYVEKFVWDMQRLWRERMGIETLPVIAISELLEDEIYKNALKEFSLSESAHVWQKRDCMIYYQEVSDKVIRVMQTKPGNWMRKYYDKYKTSPKPLLKLLMEGEQITAKKPTSASFLTKQKRLFNAGPKTNKPGRKAKASKTLQTSAQPQQEQVEMSGNFPFENLPVISQQHEMDFCFNEDSLDLGLDFSEGLPDFGLDDDLADLDGTNSSGNY